MFVLRNREPLVDKVLSAVKWLLPHTQLIPIGVPLSLSGGCDSSKSGKEGQRKRAKRAFVDQDYGSRTATFPGGEIHTCHVSARSPSLSLSL